MIEGTHSEDKGFRDDQSTPITIDPSLLLLATSSNDQSADDSSILSDETITEVQPYFADVDIPSPPLVRSQIPFGIMDIDLILRFVQNWRYVITQSKMQYDAGVGRRNWWCNDEERLADAAQELYLYVVGNRAFCQAPWWQPEFDMLNPIDGSLMVLGTAECPHPMILRHIFSSYLAARKSIIDAVRYLIVPLGRAGRYGPPQELKTTNFLDVPSILPNVPNTPYGGLLMADIMSLVLLSGHTSILKHWRGLGPDHPMIPIQTVQLGATIGIWIAMNLRPIAQRALTESNFGLMYNEHGQVICGLLMDPQTAHRYFELENVWLRGSSDHNLNV